MQCFALFLAAKSKKTHCALKFNALHCFLLQNAVQCIVCQCSLVQCIVLQLSAISEGFVYSSLYHLESLPLLLDKIHICILIIDLKIYFFDDDDNDDNDDDDNDDDLSLPTD